MPDRLRGKVAIVPGGASGIGKAIATLFVAEGAKVAVCDRNADSLGQLSDQMLKLRCDISDAAQVREMIRAVVDRFGRLDVIVNNAGVRASIVTAEHLTEEEWNRT